jgi:hypothetical protein
MRPFVIVGNGNLDAIACRGPKRALGAPRNGRRGQLRARTNSPMAYRLLLGQEVQECLVEGTWILVTHEVRCSGHDDQSAS